MYQNYRNFDVVEVQIMDIYLLKSLIWLVIFCTSARLGVDKKTSSNQPKRTNKGDRLQ